ncbi:hypothetical protein EYC84_010835 [Monilinia fructicola]|uniref:Uncharacterized protein n=1 Tax=Monilinia fructicola TaxID=38448 RepID=A0A5M9J6E9_MONFR|nr:hypothetical protein EYC84_010835 [Monilinia fructicola]
MHEIVCTATQKTHKIRYEKHQPEKPQSTGGTSPSKNDRSLALDEGETKLPGNQKGREWNASSSHYSIEIKKLSTPAPSSTHLYRKSSRKQGKRKPAPTIPFTVTKERKEKKKTFDKSRLS